MKQGLTGNCNFAQESIVTVVFKRVSLAGRLSPLRISSAGVGLAAGAGAAAGG